MFSLLVSTTFGLDISKAKELYRQYLTASDNEISIAVKKTVEKDLPIYRFLKLWAVGSEEKSESSKKTGDFLNEYYKTFEKESDDLALALAMYLTYLESKKNSKKFNVSFIQGAVVFNEFFNDYQVRLLDAFGNYAQDLVAYYLGKEIEFSNIPNLGLDRKKEDFEYSPVYKGEELASIEILLQDEAIQGILKENIESALKNEEDFDTETLIVRTRGMIVRRLFGEIARLKSKFAEEFVSITPVKKDFWWIRIVIYVLIFGYFIFKRMNLKLPVLVLLISESIYIGTVFNINSLGDGLLYGLILLIAFVLTTGIYFYKKNYLLAIISLITILTLFLPSLWTDSIKVDGTFKTSIFCNLLVNDLFQDRFGFFQKNVRELNSLVSESLRDFDNIPFDLENVPENLYESNNFKGRIDFVNKLLKERNDIVFEEFLYSEIRREKKYNKILKEIESYILKVSKIDGFQDDVVSTIERNFDEKNAKKILEPLKNVKSDQNIGIIGSRVKNILVATILFYLGILFLALGFDEGIIPLFASLGTALMTFFGLQEVFVEFGVPNISVTSTLEIPWILISTVIFAFVYLKKDLSFRRREKV